MKQTIINTLIELLSYKTYKDNVDEIHQLFQMIKTKYSHLMIQEYIFHDHEAMVLSNAEGYDFDVLFCCHVDVVYDDTYQITEDKDTLYGRGTIDMKGSVAVCLTLLDTISTDLKIALLLTSDEEIDGYSAEELSKLYTGKVCIVPDGGSNFQLITEEKGLLQISLTTHTETAHAAQLFNGENAILKLMSVYEKIIQKYPIPTSSDEYITSVNLSKLEGGDSFNQVPGDATMVLDIRNVLKDKQEDILSFIQGIDSSVDVQVLTQGPVFESDLSSTYVQTYLNVSQKVLGRDISKVGCESTSDAIFFSTKKIPTIIMNPDGYYAHSPKEYVKKDSLYQLYQIYQFFIEEISNELH